MLKWLELGVEVLKTVCDYRNDFGVMLESEERNEGEEACDADRLVRCFCIIVLLADMLTMVL